MHILSPGKHDRSLPQPSSGEPDLSLERRPTGSRSSPSQPRMSTALWTLHESGPSPLDWVMAASIGGSERQLTQLATRATARATGSSGVAGAGRTLAYSWDDVEYVDPDACLSGMASCKQKIADGGIRLVTRTDVTSSPEQRPRSSSPRRPGASRTSPPRSSSPAGRR